MIKENFKKEKLKTLEILYIFRLLETLETLEVLKLLEYLEVSRFCIEFDTFSKLVGREKPSQTKF